jgi:hypothetical protein
MCQLLVPAKYATVADGDSRVNVVYTNEFVLDKYFAFLRLGHRYVGLVLQHIRATRLFDLDSFHGLRQR